jgi:ribulose 1,5-bisphosphate synthetase/thiazole synthase
MISLWDKESFLENDLLIVGGGLVGLSVAASVLEKDNKKKVLILEKGILPFGASTKNAGFLCTDSFTELVYDIGIMGEKEAVNLFLKRC